MGVLAAFRLGVAAVTVVGPVGAISAGDLFAALAVAWVASF